MKTTHLEMRPIFVRKEESTRGHVFTVMLALLLQRELEKMWKELDLTVKEGIDELGAIHSEEICIGKMRMQKIPIPNKIGQELLSKAGITLPDMLPFRMAYMHTKKTLASEII